MKTFGLNVDRVKVYPGCSFKLRLVKQAICKKTYWNEYPWDIIG